MFYVVEKQEEDDMLELDFDIEPMKATVKVYHNVLVFYTMYSALIHIVGISAFKNAVLLLLLCFID